MKNKVLSIYRNYQFEIKKPNQPVLHIVQNNTMRQVHKDPTVQSLYTRIAMNTRSYFNDIDMKWQFNPKRSTLNVEFYDYDDVYLYTTSFYAHAYDTPVMAGPFNAISIPYTQAIHDLYFEKDAMGDVFKDFDTRKPCHFYIRANDPNISNFYEALGRLDIRDPYGIFAPGTRTGYYYFLCLEVYEPIASWLIVYSDYPACFIQTIQ